MGGIARAALMFLAFSDYKVKEVSSLKFHGLCKPMNIPSACLPLLKKGEKFEGEAFAKQGRRRNGRMPLFRITRRTAVQVFIKLYKMK